MLPCVPGEVFISYSRSDEAYVQALVAYLRAHGLVVWVDNELHHGDRWASVIEAKVADCAVLVPVMSPAARQSQWVEREINGAERLGKKIMPVLLAGEPFFRLSNLQFADLRGGAMPQAKFIEDLRFLVGLPTRAVPAGPPPAPTLPPVLAAGLPLVPGTAMPVVPARTAGFNAPPAGFRPRRRGLAVTGYVLAYVLSATLLFFGVLGIADQELDTFMLAEVLATLPVVVWLLVAAIIGHRSGRNRSFYWAACTLAGLMLALAVIQPLEGDSSRTLVDLVWAALSAAPAILVWRPAKRP
jgi:hypothetical protein